MSLLIIFCHTDLQIDSMSSFRDIRGGEGAKLPPPIPLRIYKKHDSVGRLMIPCYHFKKAKFWNKIIMDLKRSINLSPIAPERRGEKEWLTKNLNMAHHCILVKKSFPYSVLNEPDSLLTLTRSGFCYKKMYNKKVQKFNHHSHTLKTFVKW